MIKSGCKKYVLQRHFMVDESFYQMLTIFVIYIDLNDTLKGFCSRYDKKKNNKNNMFMLNKPRYEFVNELSVFLGIKYSCHLYIVNC